MRLFEILQPLDFLPIMEALEDKIAHIVDKQGEKIMIALNVDLYPENPDPKVWSEKGVVTALAKASEKYLQWVVNRYINGDFDIEDVEQIRLDIKEFERVKSRLENKDLNSYKNLPALYSALKEFKDEDITSHKEDERQKKKQFFESGDAKQFFKDGKISVVIPKTMEASMYFGRHTKWCTTWSDPSKNLFDSYNKMGNLYIIMTSDGTKFQFHFEKQEFTDEYNEYVDLLDLTEDYPSILDAFNDIAIQKDVLALVKNQTDKVCKEFIDRDADNLRYVRDQTEKICKYAISRDKKALQYVIDQTPEIIEYAFQKSPSSLAYVNTELKTPDMCRKSVEYEAWNLHAVPTQIQIDHPDICWTALRRNPQTFGAIPEKAQTEKMALYAMRKDYHLGNVIKNRSLNLRVRAQVPTPQPPNIQ
jgi:hypothetical protein